MNKRKNERTCAKTSFTLKREFSSSKPLRLESGDYRGTHIKRKVRHKTKQTFVLIILVLPILLIQKDLKLITK